MRDGSMSVKGNFGDGIDYDPNSYGGPKAVPSAAIDTFQIAPNSVVGRYPFTHPNSNFDQPAAFWNNLSPDD